MTLPNWLKNVVLIVLGIFSAAFGLKGFLLSSRFIDGGVTGISMLLSGYTGWPLPLLLLIFNAPFVWWGYRQIGRTFALKSAAAILGLVLVLSTVPFPDVTPDLLLTAVFGGMFIGAGIGLAMRGGAVLDGTEIAALLLSRSSHLFKVGDIILLLNIVIFSVAAWLLGVDLALYSILTYVAASKAIDFLVHGLEEYTAVLVVSVQHRQIQERVMAQGWGVTVLRGAEGHGKHGTREQPADVLYIVITRLEIGRLKSIIDDLDADAFMIQYGINDVAGGKVKSRPLH